MEKDKKSNNKEYDYSYIQFTISDKLKEDIKEIIEKTDYKTMSDFVRNAVEDKIRRYKNPELFEPQTLSAIDNEKIKLILEHITNNKEKTDLLLEKVNTFMKIEDSLNMLKELVNRPDIKEKELKVVDIFQEKKELRPKDISDLTGYDITTVYDILSNNDLFKLNLKNKRFRLKDD